MITMNDIFRKFATRISHIVGSPATFFLAVLVIILWAATGPLFNFSDTWQLVINTGTTIVTFLIVFLIQNTQNRDTKALHLKLDELIRTNSKARNGMVNLETLSDEELDSLQQQFEHLRRSHEELEEDLTELSNEIETANSESRD
jgi:low affinity Fe/Cu permease